MADSSRSVFRFGPFELDERERQLLRDGELVSLTPKSFDLLVVFVTRANRLLSKEELMEAVWPGQFVEEGNLTFNVSSLRKALGQGSDVSYIETVPRSGYRFVAPVTAADASAPVAIATPPRPLWPLWIAMAVAVAVGLVSTLLLFRPSSRMERRPSPPSIALLPFRNLAAPADDYLAVGLTDVLITRLSGIRHMVVRPTSSVLKYSGRTVDPIAAGRELHVDAIADGSVQHIGDRIRVTVRLIAVRDGGAIWADSFDEPFTDMFAVEDRVASRVAEALLPRLQPEERQRLARRQTGSTDAYQAYLRGRYLWNKRTPEAMQSAIALFNESLHHDPRYTLAWTGLADCYNLMTQNSGGLPRLYAGQARGAALKALAIDPQLSEAHAALALTKYQFDWDFAGADAEFKEAIRDNPNYSPAHLWYADLLSATGHMDRAVEEAARALDLDPLSLATNAAFAHHLYFAHRYSEAISHLQRSLQLDPDFTAAHLVLGKSYAQTGKLDAMVAEMETMARLPGNQSRAMAWLGYAYGRAGRTADARRLIADAARPGAQGRSPAVILGIVHTGLGENDQAIADFESALSDRVPILLTLSVDPAFDPLRGKPRFQALLSRIGLDH